MINGSEDRIRQGNSRLRLCAGVVLGLVLVAGTAFAAAPGAGTGDAAIREGARAPWSISELESRVERVTDGWAELARHYDDEVAPIARVLRRYTDDGPLASRVAAAVVREANAASLHPRLLLGVLLVENPWLDTTARSSVGAVGLMQIMPVHRGGWQCGWDLEQVDTNVCLGARVFAHYLQRTGGDVEDALLRYNGCVNGTNTPNCHQYPSRVLALSGSSLLAWAGQGASAGSP